MYYYQLYQDPELQFAQNGLKYLCKSFLLQIMPARIYCLFETLADIIIVPALKKCVELIVNFFWLHLTSICIARGPVILLTNCEKQFSQYFCANDQVKVYLFPQQKQKTAFWLNETKLIGIGLDFNFGVGSKEFSFAFVSSILEMF